MLEEQIEEKKEAAPKKIIPYAFEKELIEKQKRKVKLYDTFKAPQNVTVLTSKFYSKYDDTVELGKSINASDKAPKSHKETMNLPLTGNQIYGWMQNYMEKNRLKCELNQMKFPKQRCDITILQEKFCRDYAMGTELFTGKRFISI